MPLSASPWDMDDPLGEESHTPVPRLVHRYPDRALLLVTGKCARYCRHCFRRSLTRGGGDPTGPLTDRELAAVLDYLASHREVGELLLSGGDPLTLADEVLFAIIDAIRSARPGLLLRVCTRVPIVAPDRVTPGLIAGLRTRHPLRVAVQVNHPVELEGSAAAALLAISAAALPVLTQTVLLRGTNDEASILVRLFRRVAELRLQPYYLFQTDLARGTAAFRVSLPRAIGLARAVREVLPPEVLPKFAVDLPGGGGKVDLLGTEPLRMESDRWVYTGSGGREYSYPVEVEPGQEGGAA